MAFDVASVIQCYGAEWGESFPSFGSMLLRGQHQIVSAAPVERGIANESDLVVNPLQRPLLSQIGLPAVAENIRAMAAICCHNPGILRQKYRRTATAVWGKWVKMHILFSALV